MASPKPVPSRAALNALRGLVFTTSCSVILLAEERRRRTKVARAAIDNARKLHTVKARRRPVAMLDSRFSESELELLPVGQATGAPRPRRRRSSLGQNISASEGSSEAETLAAKAAVLDYFDRPTNRFSDSRGVPNHDSSTTRAELSCKTDSESLESDLPETLAPLAEPLNDTLLPRRLRTESLKPQAREEMEAAISASTSKVLDAINSGDRNRVDPLSFEVLNYLDSFPRYDAQGKPRYQHAFPVLKRLLEELESPKVGNTMTAVYQDLALQVFKEVISQNPPKTGSTMVRKLRLHCLALLKTIILLNPSQMSAALDVVMPLYKDVAQLSAPLMHWLVETNNREGLRQLLQYLSDLPPSTFTLDESSVLLLLDGHAKRFKSPSDTRRVYVALRNAELSKFLDLTLNTEYKQHRLLLQIAYQHSNIAMCLEEIEELHKIDPQRTSTDPQLCGALLVVEATTSWEPSVEAHLLRLKDIANPGSEEFFSILSRLVDVWAQRLPTNTFEKVVRGLVDEYHLPLKNRWMYPILQHHSNSVDDGAMFSWLQFCCQKGYRPDNKFLQKFYHLCRTRWRVSDDELALFYEALREADPSLPPPSALAKVDFNKEIKPSVSRPRQTLEDWETMYIRSAERLVSGKPCSDSKAFNSMQALAFSGNWENVWASYEESCSSTVAFSLRCLRLAVLARLKLDNGATERTSRLIDESHSRGLDVNEALTPLLMAQIAERRNVGDLIRDNLRRGFRIHDMVYNRAAQSASHAGHLRESVEICETAAAQNGKEDLIYSPYNYANLLFAYTGLGAYQQLASLLSSFTAEKRWWAGTKVSMQAMKLAMKLAAKRTAIAHTRYESRKHSAVLAKLNVAFQHGARCKKSSDEQMVMMDALTEICRKPCTPNPDSGKASKPAEGNDSAKLSEVSRTERSPPDSMNPQVQEDRQKSAPVRYMTLKPREYQKETTSKQGGKYTMSPRPKQQGRTKMPMRPKAFVTIVS